MIGEDSETIRRHDRYTTAIWIRMNELKDVATMRDMRVDIENNC